MSHLRYFCLAAAFAFPVLTVSAGAAPDANPTTSASAPDDWTSWGYDQERTSWNRGETSLTTKNVSRLKLKWTSQLSTAPSDAVLSTLTAPVVAEGVSTPQGSKNLAIVLGADDTIFALDTDNGKVLWQKTFANSYTARRPATWLCPNTANDTPAIDKARGIAFFVTSDGRLRAVSLADGAERMAATDFLEPFSRAWSLNLIDGVVYTTSGRGCGEVLNPGLALADAAREETPRPNAGPSAAGGGSGGAAPAGAPPRPAGGAPAGGAGRPGFGPPVTPDPGAISAMDVHDLAHPIPSYFIASTGRPSGAWGRGGVAKTPTGIITQTADGPYDPASGMFGNTVLELAPKLAKLTDSFTASNWKSISARDLDLGSGSLLVFPFQGHTLAASEGKEGVMYLLDTASLGGSDHATPYFKSAQLGNDAGSSIEPGQGMWGAMATYQAPDGKRFIYQPMWGPPSASAPPFQHSNGPIPNGSIMAFEVVANGGAPSLVPAWSSPDMTVPDAPSVANGIVFATQTGEQTLQGQKLPPGSPRPTMAQSNAFRSTPVSHLILYAFDAETGKQLYSSKDMIKGWTHFSIPVVALGKVFVVTHDAKVYAFGL